MNTPHPIFSGLLRIAPAITVKCALTSAKASENTNVMQIYNLISPGNCNLLEQWDVSGWGYRQDCNVIQKEKERVQ